ncbi:MAG: methylamine utilization protein MauG [Rhodobacter sp.]|nr:methylamine utilization protein MauG [Rhodobacter sp.]
MTLFHQVARLFDLGVRGEGNQNSHRKGDTARNGAHGRLHGLLLAFVSALPAYAVDLPEPLTDDHFIQFDRRQAEIGRLLFYDKILSGNRNISCGTCHHHDLGSSDGLSLGIGEGGEGRGPGRTAGKGADRVQRRIPRNAPALWNLGAHEVRFMFHDGRISASSLYDNGFNTPAEEFLPKGLNSLLAAQALFPMASDAEMAGQPGENEVAGAIRERMDHAWPIIAKRVRGIEEYGRLFVNAFENIDNPSDVTIVEIANAVGAFIGTEFRNHDSPFDRYLEGQGNALTARQLRGMKLFFGDARCSDCHSGPLLSGQTFHALGLPQFGPGRTRRFDPSARDVGRMGESDDLRDAYRFRVPFLRNVALTGPYGHNGSMPTLDDMVRHHLRPAESNIAWRPEMAILPPAPWLAAVDYVARQDRLETRRLLAAIEIDLPPLSDRQVSDLVAFLNALTGETALERPMGRPERVPSGLPVD